MNTRYHLIIFDWEGTLGDNFGHVVEAIQTEAQACQIAIDEQVVRQNVLFGLPVIMQKLFGHLSSELQTKLKEHIQNRLVARTTEVYLFPGAETLIRMLKENGIHLAVATNKGQGSLLRVLELSGLESFFDVTRSAGQTPPKPCPQMLEEILEETGIPVEKALMVGDSMSDIEMACSLGVEAVGLNHYQQPEVEKDLLKAGAKAVFSNFSQLSDFILKRKFH